MNQLIRLLLVIVTSIGISQIDMVIPSDVYNTLYTVIGIFFSIGFSIVISFDMSNVTNQVFVTKVRKGLKPVMWSFIGYFGIATVLFLFSGIADCLSFTVLGVKYAFSALILSAFIYVLIYMITNFIILQKFKDKIGDEIRSKQ